MADESLTPRQVAEQLGVTVRTVQRWIASGRLPATRVGGRLRVSRSSPAGLAALGGVVTPGAGAGPAARAPIRRLLIANRGEIAARIARTAHRLGIEVVRVQAPDEPRPAGGEHVQPISGYLDPEALLAAARRSAADAIHPGYGFLSESAAFATAVVDAGLTWVGPPAAAIHAMGDKAAARRTAAAHDVPLLPGYDGAAVDDATLLHAAERVGLPLVVKPAAGGGGKGMRVVRTPEQLPAALASARREARRAFGDDRLILERLLGGPRHVEIQVLFDGHGNGVHLGERDCSAQRRNQKIVEESPGPSVSSDLRERMGAAALTVARAVGYVGAGTVEFLLANDGRFYFLEMNTRLQVEHPVTEAVTGRDLVADQLRVAAGEALGFGQADVRIRGHAIEARVYAEDPEAGFLPASGIVAQVRWPPDGESIRVDAGIAEGDAITDHYDPMLAKLVARGASRAEALDRLGQALQEARILGVRTNLRFLRWLLDQPVVRDGEVRTDTIDGLLIPDPPRPSDAAWHAAAAGAREGGFLPAGEWGGGWRLNAEPAVRLRQGDEERSVPLRAAVGPQRGAVAVDPDGRTVHVEVEGQSVDFRLAVPPTVEDAARHAIAAGEGHAVLTAPMPGRVISVQAAEGDVVGAHAVVVVLEAMKMEHAVVAPMTGTVTRMAATVGGQVQRGDVLAEVSAAVPSVASPRYEQAPSPEAPGAPGAEPSA